MFPVKYDSPWNEQIMFVIREFHDRKKYPRICGVLPRAPYLQDKQIQVQKFDRVNLRFTLAWTPPEIGKNDKET
jgi:hypothetical protein